MSTFGYLPWARAILWSLMLCSSAFITGCATPAEELNPGTANFIKPGVTTRADVVKVFGEPTESIIGGGGHTLLFWQVVYWASETPSSAPFSPAEKSNARGLSVLLDANNVVTDSLYSSHSFATFLGVGSASIGTKTSDDIISQIKPNQTTRQQAEAVLGEPMMETLDTADNFVLDWDYSQGNFISGETQHNRLRLVFTRTGAVISVHVINGQ